MPYFVEITICMGFGVRPLFGRQQIAVLILAAVFIFGGGYKYCQWQQDEAVSGNAQVAGDLMLAEPMEDAGEIVVHICGAVQNPGVYDLPQGSRVVDALYKAKAVSGADLDSLNLAAPLLDGQKLVVPVKQEAQRKPTGGDHSGSSAAKVDFGGRNVPVNINTAERSALEQLPGIGPSLAGKIIEYREVNGHFRTVEEIKNVQGIGEKKFAKIKELITVY